MLNGLSMLKRVFFWSLAIGFLSGEPVVAEDAPLIRKDQFEVGGFAGFSYGVDHSRAMGGANVTYSATKWLLPYAEFSYFPSIQRTFVTRDDTGISGKRVLDLPVTDFNVGVHARIRVPKTQIVPYGVAGLGLLYSPRRKLLNYGYNPGSKTYDDKPKMEPVLSSSALALNVGGGIRYYFKEQFGARAETKIYRMTGGPLFANGDRWLFRATFGVFVQFGK